uniref:DNA mismatch repair proteins mutS family domain-containing protein n=1 Tax=Phytophthora ramorum TaxID=164328 RepID=H3HD43_PHYRM
MMRLICCPRAATSAAGFSALARRASPFCRRKAKKAQVHALSEMCGFPIGSVDSFVEKLVMHHGVKVAICNQVESASSAKKRGYNALVDRQVVRIVTPGSLVEDTMLTPKENNYLGSLFYDDEKWGLAWADLSTGEFVSTTSTSEKLASAILRCSPKEILLPSFPVENGVATGHRSRGSFIKTLDAPEQAAVSAILDYVDFTHRGVESSDHMIIDSSAWRGLELAKSLNGSKASSLLQAIDSTTTPGGARLLAAHLASPLMNLELLECRLDAVSYFYGQEQLLQRTRKQLAERLSIGVATPKDLKNVASTIDEAKRLVALDCCSGLIATEQQREDIANAAEEIYAALKDDYASLNSKSGFAEKGYFLDLSHDENAKLLKTDRGRSELEKLTLFQSLKNSVRYRSEELRQLNRELTEAVAEVERVENDIFASLRDRVLLVRDELQSMAHAISQIDVVCSHAQVALDRNFTRPLLDGSRELHIEDGRHAVVEAAHLRGSNSRSMRAFVPNSLHLAAAPIGSCWLLTGPNMGGKSTFLRQSAHLVVLAQMGSFVPAKFARVGLVDKLFCRVGSADDLAADKSTFMVEMQETSTILTQATSRSLVLMDEVGRGTAVNDGVAIAGAVLEALCAKQTRMLFATHFTALSDLVGDTCHGELRPYRMEVLEHHVDGQPKQLVFSHRVVEGLAAQSYGVNTAALAGCPPAVVARATELLRQLTHNNDEDSDDRLMDTNEAAHRLQRALSILGQQDAYPTKSPIFLRDTESQAKVVLLHRVADEVVVIQSVDDEQELIVGANGGCYFESPLLGISEEFKVDVLANGSMVFVSCRTGNALDCDGNGFPQCIDTIRRGWFLLQREVTTIPMKSPVEETAPVSSPVCGHCKDHEAKERREYIMKLVSLGKSLDEIDSILLWIELGE